ncbi:hypothetical protein ALFP_1641 [Alcaligenes faecalis]|nr:hypothetical protein ALFP_1641 [Alcaligenes faecalis]
MGSSLASLEQGGYQLWLRTFVQIMPTGNHDDVCLRKQLQPAIGLNKQCALGRQCCASRCDDPQVEQSMLRQRGAENQVRHTKMKRAEMRVSNESYEGKWL